MLGPTVGAGSGIKGLFPPSPMPFSSSRPLFTTLLKTTPRRYAEAASSEDKRPMTIPDSAGRGEVKHAIGYDVHAETVRRELS
jgi:hypothetical protein